MEEFDLLKRINQKDNEAFGVIYKKLQPEVYRYCKKIIKNDTFDIAADITMNVFLKLFTKAKYIDSLNGVKGWLLLVARNECFSYLEKQRSKKRYNQTLKEEYDYIDIGNNEQEYEKELRLVYNIVLSHADKLKGNQKISFNLFWLKGMEYTDIANKIGARMPTVYTHCCRTIKSIRKKIIKSYPEFGNKKI